MIPLVEVNVIPNKIKSDNVRPEYHRCVAYQSIENPDKIYAVSTGLQ